MILGFLAEAGREKRKKMVKRRIMDGLRSLRVKLFGKEKYSGQFPESSMQAWKG